MRERLDYWWHDVQDSLWFIPTLLTAAAAGLALLMVEIDQRLGSDEGNTEIWLYGGGVDGARGVLTAIAGTMITVTGVVFSITIVALQLASVQFTPRVLRAFTGDRGNQVVLGVFIGTFTYALLVLRTVRTEADDGERFVPALAVTVATGLSLVSVGFLIYYIHHAARSIQASVIIDRATDDTRDLIDALFTSRAGLPVLPEAVMLPSTPATPVLAGEAGYVQTVDSEALIYLARERGLTIRLTVGIGEFVLPGARLAEVWTTIGKVETAEVSEAIQGAFVLGLERTLHDDPAFGFRQLADIGIRALSPSINDPTTAMSCIDRLGELLVRLASREQPATIRTSDEGGTLLVLTTTTVEQLVELAYGQIRHYGAADAVVMVHLAETLRRISVLTPDACHEPLARQARLVRESARNKIAVEADLALVERACVWASGSEALGD